MSDCHTTWDGSPCDAVAPGGGDSDTGQHHLRGDRMSSHLEIWLHDVHQFLIGVDGPFTVTDIMLATKLGRPADERTLKLIAENPAPWHPVLGIVFHDHGRVTVERSEALPKPPVTVSLQKVACGHMHVHLDTQERTATCNECGRLVDPFDRLVGIANNWRRYEYELRELERRRNQLDKQCHELKAEEIRVKARINRAKSPPAPRPPKQPAPVPAEVLEIAQRIRPTPAADFIARGRKLEPEGAA